MRAFAKKWFWFLGGLTILFMVYGLYTINCGQDKAGKNQQTVGHKQKTEVEKKLAKDNDAGLRACAGDYDCLLASTNCQNGVCVSDLTDEGWYNDGGN